MPQEGGEVVNNEAAQNTAPVESTATETKDSETSQEPQYKTIIAENGEVTRIPVESDDEGNNPRGDKAEADGERAKRGAEARKEQLQRETEAAQAENARIREAVAEKNRAIAEQRRLQAELDRIQQASTESERIPSVDYIMQQENPETGDFYTEYEARMMHENLKLKYKVEQQEQMAAQQAYESRIEASVGGFAADIQQTLKDFPVFDEASDEYDPSLSAEAERIMLDALIFEPNTGRIIGSSIPVYQLYKTLHEAAKGSLEARKSTQQSVRQQELAQADVRGSGQRLKKPFEKMTLKEQEAYLRQKGHDI